MRITIFMTLYYLRKYKNQSIKRLLLILSTRLSFPIFLAALFFLQSCTEKPVITGLNLLPGGDFVNIRSTDTISIFSFTEYADSVPSKNKTAAFLGGIYDPYFGTMTSDFVAQLRLLQKWPEGGQPFVIDSVKMIIRISGAKGLLGVNQDISLYEITEMLDADSVYYSKRDPHAGLHLGTFALPKIEKDTIQNLEIMIPISIGEYLMRDTLKLRQDNSGNDFRNYFKGLYVSVSEGQTLPDKKDGANPSKLLLSLSFSDQYNYPFIIDVFYHTALKTGQYYSFVMSDKSVRYNRYFHDFSTAEPDKRIAHINDGVKDTLSYLQSFYGASTRITFPGLQTFRDSSRLSVNRARITIPVYVDGVVYKATSIPTSIFLIYKNSEGYSYIVPDYYMSSAFYNGNLNSTTLNFTFNIAAFVQTYIDGKIPEAQLSLSLSDSEYRNLILKANNSHTPVKFELTYTRY
ncbi:MAG TPA: DUF4270 family protein [Bacteroidales bacterium]|nr:DUF4270 family protein [Bacteroidales bacterium]HRT88692.1 DUF4270 family protein [Bacteroidales bacterium]